MKHQEKIDFERVAEALGYIRENFRKQPDLNEVAEKVHMSPFHFQRLFTKWAGVSPKKFLQYISLEHAKMLLKDDAASLFKAAHKTGLSGTGRLHDLFVNIEGMTPAEYRDGGKNLSINYSFATSPFGDILIASTQKGICFLAFVENERHELAGLQDGFPQATFTKKFDAIQENALRIFTDDWRKLDQIKLHLKATDFQLKVWEALLKIPMGKVSTYGKVAQGIGHPAAGRAVGTAIGRNPIAFLIPCHRVIRSSGVFGDYHWGGTRKIAMIGWESARTEK